MFSSLPIRPAFPPLTGRAVKYEELVRNFRIAGGSATCRVADSPDGTPNAHPVHFSAAHATLPDGVAQGLKVSRGYVIQHQLLQSQLTHQTLQLHVLLVELF